MKAFVGSVGASGKDCACGLSKPDYFVVAVWLLCRVRAKWVMCIQ